jgi:hypothetical protein
MFLGSLAWTFAAAIVHLAAAFREPECNRNQVKAAPLFTPALADTSKELGAAKVRIAQSLRGSSTRASIDPKINGAEVRIAARSADTGVRFD